MPIWTKRNSLIHLSSPFIRFVLALSVPPLQLSTNRRSYPCRWKPCSSKTFPTVDELLDHVMGHHLKHAFLTCPLTGTFALPLNSTRLDSVMKIAAGHRIIPLSCDVIYTTSIRSAQSSSPVTFRRHQRHLTVPHKTPYPFP
jgi:hypothetical protein